MSTPNDDGEPQQGMAWDPKCPTSLIVPSVAGSEQDKPIVLNTIVSHNGVGCNPHETTAVLELLDARDAYLKASHETNASESSALSSLSLAYRKALSRAAASWEGQEVAQDQAISENLEWLKVSNSIVHLSEIFLLTPNLSVDDAVSNLPGAATADTIRYLRHHHLVDPKNVISDEMYDLLNDSVQPEQLEDGIPFWSHVQANVLQGCLDNAWNILSRHSYRVRAAQASNMEGLDEYQAVAFEQDRQGFAALEAVLRSAPLPGGRSDADDEDGEPEEEEKVEEEDFLEGIPTLAYKLWESSMIRRGSGDFPVHFQGDVAYQRFQAWQYAVRGLPELQNLARRIPELQSILSILVGDFANADVQFDSWDEQLCAELLYKIPHIRLIDLHARAARIMEKHQDDETGDEWEGVILQVMKGNGGSVIDSLHQIGGGSGAALPALMTFLLYDLMEEAKIILSPAEVAFNIKTELLLAAALAVRSSMAMEGNNDLGTRLCVRLLIPYITLDSDMEITATLVDTLEHHYPQTDAEAKTLLELCRGLVLRKNRRVAEGCVSVAMARYRHFMAEQRPGGAVHWLVTGMELESNIWCGGPQRTGAWQTALSMGTCYRQIVSVCNEVSDSLLESMLQDGAGSANLYTRGVEMIAVLQEDNLARYMPAVQMLDNVLIIADAVADRKDYSVMATGIVACLEERADDEDDGVVSCLAGPSMQWSLIRLARIILDRYTERDSLEDLHVFAACFDVRGMQVLMERFTILTATAEMEKTALTTPDEILGIRHALAEGLMRAFVAENATKQLPSNSGNRASVAGVLSSQLGGVSREKQELVVQSMLDF
eukprot:Nitzschia sp. Nitz4//scaffold20_size174350//130111//132670//NITZ4_002119-RA/size174350-snap-gene-0.250-mRNA-1//-1//CDS//3329541860//9422//frame0